MDVLLLMPFRKGMLLQVWVALKLTTGLLASRLPADLSSDNIGGSSGEEQYILCGRNNSAVGDEILDLALREVANANGSDFAGLLYLLHRLPCIDVGGLSGLNLAIRIFGDELVSRFESIRPVHEV